MGWRTQRNRKRAIKFLKKFYNALKQCDSYQDKDCKQIIEFSSNEYIIDYLYDLEIWYGEIIEEYKYDTKYRVMICPNFLSKVSSMFPRFEKNNQAIK